MTPLVSIGIPTYDRPALLAEAIASALRQSVADLEVIVSDDCSPNDATAQAVAAFGDARLRYHRPAANLRPPRNWNECLRLARGEFFVLLPDDDLLAPDFLAKLLPALRAQPAAGFAQCGYQRIDAERRPIDTILQPPPRPHLAGPEALLWQIENLMCIPASVVFRRAALAEQGGWREDYWDDWAGLLRLAYRRGFVYLPESLAYNRTHGGNLNRVLHRERRDAILDLINQYADVFGAALPATPELEAARARINRELGQHCVLLALSAARRGEWASVGFHWRRAHQLHALAGLDLGMIGLWLKLRRTARRFQTLQAAARQAVPIPNPSEPVSL